MRRNNQINNNGKFTLWHGLMYYKQLRLSNVNIEGDALNVLNSLKMDLLDLSEIGEVLDEIRLMLYDFILVSWKHVWKRGVLIGAVIVL